jgi:hypothetical protein
LQVSALQFDDIQEGLRNIQVPSAPCRTPFLHLTREFHQNALRMLKGQAPAINFSAQPERGKIFDAEDTARHAVSALK